MKFSELSKGQKRCVIGLLEANTSLKKASSVSRKDIVETWENIKEKGSKIGFPNWLLTSKFNAKRGFYTIPKPTAKDIEEYKNPTKKPKKKKLVEKKPKEVKVSQARLDFESKSLSQEDMEYYSTLDRYGIPF